MSFRPNFSRDRIWASLAALALFALAALSAFSILKRPLGPGSVVLGGLTLIFLGLGGIAYMAGTVFYAWEKLPYHHAIWHLFVVAGSTMHFFSIYHAVIPKSV